MNFFALVDPSSGMYEGFFMEKLQISQDHLMQFKQPASFEVPAGSDVGLNNVMGISKFPIPARFLSGFIPTFELAKSIATETDGKIEPVVRIFIPKHISLHVNGLNHTHVQQQIENGKKIIEVFGKTIFPDVPLIIEEDEPFTDESEEVLRSVETVIFDKAHDQNTDDETAQSIRSILMSGKKRGGERGEQNALLYGAHHPFGWHDLFHPAVFAAKPKEFEISTLPPSERPFFALRGHIKEVLDIQNNPLLSQIEQINLIINMCGTPHYLPIIDSEENIHEPLFEDITSVPLREISGDMQQRFKGSSDSKLRENLRRARADFDRVASVLSQEEVTLFDATISDVLPIEK